MSAGSSIFADSSSSPPAWIFTKPSAAYAPRARNRFASPYSARDSTSGRTSSRGSDHSKLRWEMHWSGPHDRSDIADAGSVDHLDRDKDCDALGLGLVGRRLQRHDRIGLPR